MSPLAELFISVMAGVGLVALILLAAIAAVPVARFLWRCHLRGLARVRADELRGDRRVHRFTGRAD